MSYALGVDIGTSSVTTAIARPGDGDAEPLSSHRGARFPSVLFIDDDGAVHVGAAAEARGRNQPERVIRGVVDRIGDDVPIVVGGSRFTPQRLYAALARSAVDRIAHGEGTSPEAVRIAIPSHWGAHRSGAVRRALIEVGLAGATLVTGADAAAAAWSEAGGTLEEGAAIAVYDLGATGFRVTVLRRSAAGTLHLVSVDGADDIGGDDVDDAVLRHVVASATDLFDDFDSVEADAASAIAALRVECTRAKEALATVTETTVAVRLPRAAGDVVLDRDALEGIADQPLRATLPVLRRALATAGIGPGGPVALLLVGATTRMPLVSRILTEEFGCAVLSNGDPEAAAASGAAITAAAALGRREELVGVVAPGVVAPQIVAPEDDTQRQPSRRTGLGRGAATASRVLRRGTGAVAAAMVGIFGVQVGAEGEPVGGSDPGGSAG